MAIEVIKVTDGTQTPIAFDVVGTVYEQVVKLDISADGAASPTLYDGKVVGGTINASTATVTSGSIVVTAGTIAAGTVTSITDVANLAKGTITRVEGGTVNEVTTVSNLTNGTVRVSVGTITTGTVTVTSGTLQTHFAEDAGHTTGDKGELIFAVRNDGGTSLSGTDLDYTPLSLDANGALRTTGTVNMVSAGTITRVEGGTLGLITTLSNVSNGTIRVTEGTIAAGTITNLLKVEDAGHTTGDSGVMVMGVRVDGGTSLVGTDLDYAPLMLDANGALRISGTVATGAGTQSVRLIDGTLTSLTNLAAGTVTRLEGGSIAVTAATVTNLLKVEDAGHTTGDSGVMIMGVRVDGGTSLVGTDLDYAPLQVDANGALRVVGTVTNTVQVGTINVGTINTGTINTGTVTVTSGTVVGNIAHDGADSGNPIKIGGKAGTAEPGTVAHGDRVDAYFDDKGYQYTKIGAGTITSITDVANLAKGTITKIEGGTLGLVTTVSNLTNGSVAVTAGTLQTHFAEDAGHTTGDKGELVLAVRNDGGTSLSGTDLDYTPLSLDANGALRTFGTVPMISAGTITRVEGGTIGLVSTVTTVTTVSNLTNGTVRISDGTITHGTIDNGTLSARNTENILTYGTQFAATAAAYGTLVGSASVGSGTSLYLDSYEIINPAGTVLVRLGHGTALQGTSVYFRGVLGTHTVGGITKSYSKASNAGMTNQDLTVYLGAAGTVDVNVSYFIKV